MKIEEISNTEINAEQLMKIETVDDIIQVYKEACEGDKGK